MKVLYLNGKILFQVDIDFDFVDIQSSELEFIKRQWKLITEDMSDKLISAEKEVVKIKSMYDLKIMDHGPKKIQAIKLVRNLTSAGLKEAKEFVEGIPIPMFNFFNGYSINYDEAQKRKKEFEEIGVVTEIMEVKK